VPVKFEELLDPATGRIRVRLVDVATESYEVARSYMIRLDTADLVEPPLSRLSAQSPLTLERFAARFAAVVNGKKGHLVERSEA